MAHNFSRKYAFKFKRSMSVNYVRIIENYVYCIYVQRHKMILCKPLHMKLLKLEI